MPRIHQQKEKSMLTVLWKMPNGGEEIYVAPSVSRVPALVAEAAELEAADCHGAAHIAMQVATGKGTERTVISIGEVFVMNAEGRTVATYRF
ncbi:hypothetical protein QMZ05_12755 [Bradyrhizobium sp. INPA03-11B]|uniref:hypothetical protein n=1 Tax=Bradyrhizobium sp. INPA03-11B TaxID=418598 RepID=UPI00338DEEB6